MSLIGACFRARPNRLNAIGSADSKELPYAITAGLITSLGVGILLSLSRSVGFDPGIATLLVLLAATIMLFVIYPEKPRRIGLAGISALLGAGVLAACGWLAITD